jgi:hypothetical protein
VRSLSRRLRAAYVVFGAVLLAQSVLFFGLKTQADNEIIDNSGKVIKTRGIIVVDDQGRERVLIGAPIPRSKNRVFTDKTRAFAAWKDRIPENAKAYRDNFNKLETGAVGMLVLDENGFDRMSVGGRLPDPNTGKRIGVPTGISVNNDKGFERAGFRVMNINGDARVALGMDSENGEALTLSVINGIGVGLRMNDSKNKLFMGTLAPQKWENKTDQPFSGYLFREGDDV